MFRKLKFETYYSNLRARLLSQRTWVYRRFALPVRWFYLSIQLIMPLNWQTTSMGWQDFPERSNILMCVVGRVEKLAVASSATVNFAPLRAAIRSLQFASLKLDGEKFVAERALRDQLRKLRKDKRKQKQNDGYLKRFFRRLKGLFQEESNDVAVSAPRFANEKPPLKLGRAPDFGNDHEVNVEERNWPRLPWPRKPKHPPCLPPKFIKALMVVRKINQKLASFERGFIHEDGIKDREWYRHLGVAPGKWLGKTSLVRRRKCIQCFL
jgi:N-acetylated-alpha-linked acidic dipeptidase